MRGWIATISPFLFEGEEKQIREVMNLSLEYPGVAKELKTLLEQYKDK
jgi:hypothetical protein